MKVLLTHPTGNQNVRALLRALEQEGFLHAFHTSIAISPENPLLRFLPERIAKELHRRVYPVNYAEIRTRPMLELGRFLMPRLGFKQLLKHETGPLSIDKVCLDLDLHTAAKIKGLKNLLPNAVYAYEDTAVEIFKAARQQGMHCLYDLPIGYWRRARALLQQEGERWPEWLSTLHGLTDSEEKLARKDDELRLADQIFVASSFTAKTLQDYPGKLSPVRVIPYGFPDIAVNRKYTDLSKRRLKLLYVGSLSQRKGIADMFAALQDLRTEVELTLVGRKTGADCPALDAALKQHKWIPGVTHAEVLELMQEQDVLLFPSLFEGFGLVITEAMSQGMPVITTERTAGPDLICHGENGWLIEAGSTIALRQAIEMLLNQPDTIPAAGLAAMETARKRPWSAYGQELTTVLKNVVHENA